MENSERGVEPEDYPLSGQAFQDDKKMWSATL